MSQNKHMEHQGLFFHQQEVTAKQISFSQKKWKTKVSKSNAIYCSFYSMILDSSIARCNKSWCQTQTFINTNLIKTNKWRQTNNVRKIQSFSCSWAAVAHHSKSTLEVATNFQYCLWLKKMKKRRFSEIHGTSNTFSWLFKWKTSLPPPPTVDILFC